MTEDLQKAYAAYQQALFHLNDPKVRTMRFCTNGTLQDPNLWYGIGILYERYGSLEHAEEAFNAVLKMNPNFEKKNETYFRLGVINKQQMKIDKVRSCFKFEQRFQFQRNFLYSSTLQWSPNFSSLVLTYL